MLELQGCTTIYGLNQVFLISLLLIVKDSGYSERPMSEDHMSPEAKGHPEQHVAKSSILKELVFLFQAWWYTPVIPAH